MDLYHQQVHYDNRDELVIPEPDTSGLRITYTSDLRPNDMAVLIVGEFNLNLPPGKSRVVAPPNVRNSLACLLYWEWGYCCRDHHSMFASASL
jgi:hypothetical protein